MLASSHQQSHCLAKHHLYYSPSPTPSYSSTPTTLPELDCALNADFANDPPPIDVSYDFSHNFPEYCVPTSPSYNSPTLAQHSTPSPAIACEASRPSVLNNKSGRPSSWSQFSNYRHLTPVGGTRKIDSQDRQISHKRNFSSSSTNSAGPASPYTPTATYPIIIDLDSQSFPSPSYDTFESAHTTSFVACQKPLACDSTSGFSDSFLAPSFQEELYALSNDADSQVVYHKSIRAVMAQQGSELGGKTSSAPSGLCRGDYDNGFKVPTEVRTNVPKLDRTMSDICQDELYNPSMTTPIQPVLSRVTPPQNNHLLSPRRDVFSERLQAANNGHISARSASPATTISRERSPFRQGSEYAAEGHSQAIDPTSRLDMNVNSVAHTQEMRKAEADARQYQRHHQPSIDPLTTPRTISPKEAVLHCSESEEYTKLPLFPSDVASRANEQSQICYSAKSLNAPDSRSLDNGDKPTQHSFTSMITTRRQNSLNPFSSTSSQFKSAFSGVIQPVPEGVQVPKQYPFISQSRRQSSNPSTSTHVPEFPTNLTSMESSRSVKDYKSPQEDSGRMSKVQRPTKTIADSGTYTCTYHGCTQRFETPLKLQKHKRDGHRQSTPQSGLIEEDVTILNANQDSQAGPHKCERLNPSTGKPCNSMFSRPYDLTRHEDTIHNSRKRKVQCRMCTEEKTFSRNDALTRHMRVVHPEIDFSGKTRRKNNS